MQNPRSDLNRLSPRSKRGVRPIAPRGQSGRRDLNPRPLQSKCSTLPTAPLPDAPLTGCTAGEGSSCANTRGHQTRRRRRESNAQPSSGARFRDGVALPLCRRLHRRGDRRDSNSLPRRPQRRASTSSASVTIRSGPTPPAGLEPAACCLEDSRSSDRATRAGRSARTRTWVASFGEMPIGHHLPDPLIQT